MIRKILSVFLILVLGFASPVFSASTSTCNDTDTKLMLHADGSDGSTTFTDSSSTPKTVTANNQAQIDTAQSKFGGASALFDGTDDYLSSVDSADWDLGAGSFTIDFWVRFNSVATNANLIAQFGVASQNAWLVQWNTSNLLRFLYTTDGSTTVTLSNSWTPTTAVWYHVAVVRNGNDLLMFIDGTQIGTTQTLSATIFNSTSDIAVGSQTGGTGTGDLNGWMDEIRLVKGTAVWTSNFTAPTGAYADTCSSTSTCTPVIFDE